MSLNALTPERIDPPDIWMTGDPNVTHKVCCAYRPTNPECNDKAWACSGVMIEAHLGRYGVTYFCRSHLDLLGEMILHTRRLREAELPIPSDEMLIDWARHRIIELNRDKNLSFGEYETMLLTLLADRLEAAGARS